MNFCYKTVLYLLFLFTLARAQNQFVEHKIADLADTQISTVTVDLDSDGDQDIISWPDTMGGIVWLENNGWENFPVHSLGDNVKNVESFVATDLDKDSDMDFIASFSNSSRINWYENDGGQNFFTWTITDSADTASNILAVDLDNSGHIDIISNKDNIIWYKNDGVQNFVYRSIYTYESNQFIGDLLPEFLLVSDINNDGDNDIFATSRSRWWFHILNNDGFQNFSIDTVHATYGCCSINQPGITVLEDFDNDEDIDLIYGATHYSGGACGCVGGFLEWFRNDLDSNFIKTRIDSGSWGAIRRMEVSDIDNDGHSDILVSSVNGWPEDSEIYWLQNDGYQNFEHHTIKPFNDSLGIGETVRVSDIDRDGDADVIASLLSQIVLFENDGNQNFDEIVIRDSAVVSVEVIDMDEDGDHDLLAILQSKIVWFENKTVTTAVTDLNETPLLFNLKPNYPNPFNAMTVINYQLPVASDVNLSIYNLLGQKITTLVSKEQSAGQYNIWWDAANYSSGVYLYKLKAGSFVQSRKMLLLR